MKTYKVILLLCWIFCGTSVVFSLIFYSSSTPKQQTSLWVLPMLCTLMAYIGTIICANIAGINHIGTVPQNNPEKFYDEERTYISAFCLIVTLLFLALTLASIFIPNFTLHHK